jgi:hypothetical protein
VVFTISITVIGIKVMIMILQRCLCNKSWCGIGIKTDVSVSFDGGKSYTRNFLPIIYRRTVYLKYEISARASGFLSNLIICEIPFLIKVPEKMTMSLHEYSGICIPTPVDGFLIKEQAEFFVYAMGRRIETAKIILKCEPAPKSEADSKTSTSFVFKLRFLDSCLKKYSKTVVLEFKEY